MIIITIIKVTCTAFCEHYVSKNTVLAVYFYYGNRKNNIILKTNQ